MYSPHPVHEQPINHLFTIVSRAVSDIPYGPLLQVNVSGNSRIYSDESIYRPRLQITITPNALVIAETELPWLVETGFSQTRDIIIDKIEKIIGSHPKLQLALIILINERGKYASPKVDSPTWEQVRLDKSLRPISKFVPMRSDDTLFGPVLDAMGHSWIDFNALYGSSPVQARMSALI